MDIIKNKLPENIIVFFKNLEYNLDTKLYFYGSVLRNDYFHGSSDIDVDIFTNNQHSMVNKLRYYLDINPHDFKKILWRLNHNNKLVKGYKVMYINEEENIKVELSIYNEYVKNDILYEHKKKIVLPYFISLVLILLKYIYYKLNLIDKKNFYYLKKKIINFGYKDGDFLVL